MASRDQTPNPRSTVHDHYPTTLSTSTLAKEQSKAIVDSYKRKHPDKPDDPELEQDIEERLQAAYDQINQLLDRSKAEELAKQSLSEQIANLSMTNQQLLQENEQLRTGMPGWFLPYAHNINYTEGNMSAMATKQNSTLTEANADVVWVNNSVTLAAILLGFGAWVLTRMGIFRILYDTVWVKGSAKVRSVFGAAPKVDKKKEALVKSTPLDEMTPEQQHHVHETVSQLYEAFGESPYDQTAGTFLHYMYDKLGWEGPKKLIGHALRLTRQETPRSDQSIQVKPERSEEQQQAGGEPSGSQPKKGSGPKEAKPENTSKGAEDKDK